MRERPQARTARTGLGLAVLALVGLVLWGGYSHHWSWTGINGRTATLWDWLKLLLLPISVAILPIWLARDVSVNREVKTAALLLAPVFGLIVLLGYVVPWGWTGFSGNTLWDWLNLVALPLAVALIPVFSDLRREWRAHHTAISLTLLAVLGVMVIGGYMGHWGWTGFTGNRLWEWLHLLLLPLLVPAVVIPSLKPRARARVSLIDGATAPPAPGAATHPVPGAATPPAPGAETPSAPDAGRAPGLPPGTPPPRS